jgi:hypothetical protein
MMVAVSTFETLSMEIVLRRLTWCARSMSVIFFAKPVRGALA